MNNFSPADMCLPDGTPLRIRPVRPADADALLAIYAPYVRDTCIPFETEVPSPGDFRARIARLCASYPYLVCERTDTGAPVGYAYASPFGERAAYRFSVEPSLYVASDCHRAGIGRALCLALFSRLRARGFATVCSVITLPNEASLALHHALGFSTVGIHRNIGYKQGAWRDVILLERPLGDHPALPAEPRFGGDASCQ